MSELPIFRPVPPGRPHRNDDGTFRNPWPGPALHGFSGLLKWSYDRRRHGVPRDPDPSVFPRVAPAFRSPRAAAGELTVTWIGHSATLVQMGGMNVLTDPMLGVRASPVSFAGPRRWVPPGVLLGGLPPIDLVLLSHNHYDHLDLGSVRGIVRRSPEARWIVPLGVGKLVRGAGAGDVAELDWWDEAEAGDLRVTATPAQHFSARGPWDRNRSLWCGFAVATSPEGSARSTGEAIGAYGTGPRRLLFAGDTGYHPEFGLIGERCGPFDVALLPIGAYEPRWFMAPVHMNPEEAVQAFVDLGGAAAGVMVGVHWGTFKLTDEPMDEPPRRAREVWSARRLPQERLWIPRHGETLVL